MRVRTAISVCRCRQKCEEFEAASICMYPIAHLRGPKDTLFIYIGGRVSKWSLGKLSSLDYITGRAKNGQLSERASPTPGASSSLVRVRYILVMLSVNNLPAFKALTSGINDPAICLTPYEERGQDYFPTLVDRDESASSGLLQIDCTIRLRAAFLLPPRAQNGDRVARVNDGKRTAVEALTIDICQGMWTILERSERQWFP